MTFFLPSDTRSGFSVRFFAQSSLVGLAAIVGLLWVVFTSLAPGLVSSFNPFAISRSLAIDIVIGFSTMVVLATGRMNLAIR
jgi:ribose transport system permease protein